jgi:hypothetical protein
MDDRVKRSCGHFRHFRHFYGILPRLRDTTNYHLTVNTAPPIIKHSVLFFGHTRSDIRLAPHTQVPGSSTAKRK